MMLKMVACFKQNIKDMNLYCQYAYTPHSKTDEKKELLAEENTQLKNKRIRIDEGDIRVDRRFQAIKSGLQSREFTTEDFGRRWEGRHIPYQFGDTASERLKEVVKAAIEDFNNYTCVRFIPRTNQMDYISFVQGHGCWSYIGKHGGDQEISLEAEDCLWKGTAIHEMMHAIGFFHEMARLDRDRYVKVHFDNIWYSMQTNFDKYLPGMASTLGEPYDIQSIMQYQAYFFAINPKKVTLSPVDPNLKPEDLGQRKGFSQLDIKQINKAFKCNTSSTPDILVKPTTAPNTPTSQTPTTKAAPKTTRATTKQKSTTVSITTTKPIATTIPPINTVRPSVLQQTTVPPPDVVTHPAPDVVTHPTPDVATVTHPMILPPRTTVTFTTQAPPPCLGCTKIVCQQEYPCWPMDFSWSTTDNSNCCHGNDDNIYSTQSPLCTCQCTHDVINQNGQVPSSLCYKRRIKDPNFLLSYKDSIPDIDIDCIKLPEDQKSTEDRFLCYSKATNYNLFFTKEIPRNSKCIPFSPQTTRDNQESYMCGRN